MTDKQKRFCDRYLTHFNGSRAAKEAGFSEKSCGQIAAQLLILPEVAEYLKERLEKASEIAMLDTVWVLKRFKEISDRCVQAEPVLVKDGKEWVETGEFKFDSSGANKATEMIGKILGSFEKDNEQQKQTVTNIVNLGTGVNPEENDTSTT